MNGVNCIRVSKEIYLIEEIYDRFSEDWCIADGTLAPEKSPTSI